METRFISNFIMIQLDQNKQVEIIKFHKHNCMI